MVPLLGTILKSKEKSEDGCDKDHQSKDNYTVEM